VICSSKTGMSSRAGAAPQLGLVSLLVRAAERVDRLYPGSVLLVGDLS
jgi:hypothetical protein